MPVPDDGEGPSRDEDGAQATTDPGDIAETLHKVASGLPGGGEDRPGQLQMAQAVARAIEERRHLVVQAGTGTGKSLAYLVPLALAGRTAVVATATKALQDQLADKDLPRVARSVEEAGGRLRFAVLKGRSNYLCRQRVAEVSGRGGPSDAAGTVAELFSITDDNGSSFGPYGDAGPAGGEDAAGPSVASDGPVSLADQLRQLVAWADTTSTGDRAELPFEPGARAWGAVSVSARECPGAFRCPSGPDCFAEHARARAAAADIVVVNTHLYATHVASDGAVLPDHDIVVFDEAHAVEEVMTSGLGVEITAGRVRAAATTSRPLVADDDTRSVDAVLDAADRLGACLRDNSGRRVLHGAAADDELHAVLELGASRVAALAGALRRQGGEDGSDWGPRRARALLAASHLAEDLERMGSMGPGRVAWVEGTGPATRQHVLKSAPIEVDGILGERLWPAVTAVLTSATVPPLLPRRLGLPSGKTDHLDVGSPFPYRENALLYCPVDLPDRRAADAEAALQDELRLLMTAAGGRTLALFTSWRAMRGAVDAIKGTVPFDILAQSDMPKPALLATFTEDETSCLFATMSFWQGVDVPGRSLSLVVLDRLPFPRPDDPLLGARRELAGEGAFRLVDLPRAATLLAQGSGRLIRSSEDRGVVAVLDRRLATAGYGPTLRQALPPMRFTTDRAAAVRFLEQMRDQ